LVTSMSMCVRHMLNKRNVDNPTTAHEIQKNGADPKARPKTNSY